MKCGERALSLISLTFGLVAAGALALAVATDFWLFTIEPIVPSENETLSDPGASILETVTIDDLDMESEVDEEAVTMIDQNGPLIVHMHSGLWRACIIYHEPGLPPEVCTSIGYFEQSSERVEQADTTNSINRAIRKTAPIIVGSLFVLFFALSLSIVGTTKNDYKTIVSAVIYIFAALGLAMGVIMYISAVNDEVAHRKKTTDSSDKSFQYRYGWAFFFSAATFICAMVAAVSNISLYLLRYSNLEDKIVVAGGGGGMTPACHTTVIATAIDSRGYLPVRIGTRSNENIPGPEIAI